MPEVGLDLFGIGQNLAELGPDSFLFYAVAKLGRARPTHLPKPWFHFGPRLLEVALNRADSGPTSADIAPTRSWAFLPDAPYGPCGQWETHRMALLDPPVCGLRVLSSRCYFDTC